MVLLSENDQLVDPMCSKSIAQKFNFDLRISQKAGHDMCVDDCLWMLDQIKSFSASI
jgi:predicted alpha/beta hydrolase family esterase